MKALSKTRRLAASLAHLNSSFAAIAVASSIAIPSAALAQATGSTLRGTAPAGVQIIAKEVNTGAVRQVTAGPDGTYVIAGLQPGTYRVTAGSSAADVIVPVASEQVQNFGEAAPATTTADRGSIVVTGTRPTTEVRTSQVNQFVTLHDIAVLPQATRNFLEFASTVPGVQFNVDSNRNTSLRGGAQLASGVNVYIDGVSQKDYVGGGSGITGSSGPQGNGDPGNPFPQLAISEYKVVTSNYSAQYGDASSAIIIAQTKSGTNRFHGEAFGTFTNQDLRSRTAAEKASGAKKGKEPSKEYGAAIGGPIVKDVAHFFFTWEHKSLSNQTVVFPAGGLTTAQAQAILPANVGSQFGSITNPFTENLYFGKIDLEPSSKDRLEATGKLRLEKTLSGGGGQAAASTRAPYRNNDKRADIRWQHNEDNWVNQALLSYQNTNSGSLQTTATPQIQYAFYPNANSSQGSSALIQVGGPGLGVGAVSRQRGFTLQEDFTYTGLHLAGDHTLRLGGSFAAIKLKTQNASSDLANATYYYAVTPNGLSATPYLIQFPVINQGVNAASVSTTAKQYSAYVQDDWNVNRRLILNLGLRWDREEVPAFLKYRTPANVVAALNGPFPGTTQSYASVLAKGSGQTPGYDINDYISTGNNRKARNNFSPRLGFSYDLHGDNRHVIFGGYARAYNRNQFGTLALEVTKVALNNNPQVYFPSPQTQDSFGPCATAADINPVNHCYAFNPAYLTPAGLQTLQISSTSGEVDLLNNHLRTPHSDQFSIGMRNKIGDWNTQATISYVKSFDAIVGRLGNRYASGAYFQNGSQWGSQGVPGIGGLILWDNGAKDKNLQVGLAAQKPYTKQSGWSATVSYTFSAAKQNNVAGGANPYSINNNQYLFDLPYASQYPWITGTAVPRHRLVATFSKDIFWGISVASKLELATPPAAATIFGCPNGQQVCNDAGGNTVFYSVRPHNTLGYKDIDLQFTKEFAFPRGIGAYARVDVLNVFNWTNWNPGDIYYPDYGVPRAAYNKSGNITGNPRTVRLTAGVRF